MHGGPCDAALGGYESAWAVRQEVRLLVDRIVLSQYELKALLHNFILLIIRFSTVIKLA